jgi:hypothetical protein
MVQTVGYLQKLQANGVDSHSCPEEFSRSTVRDWCLHSDQDEPCSCTRTTSFGWTSMRYAGLFLALGLLVATVSSAYADCPAHAQAASTDSASNNASQAKLKQSQPDRQG